MASWGTRIPGRNDPSKISHRMWEAICSPLLVRTICPSRPPSAL
jgi:hypothetical protein